MVAKLPFPNTGIYHYAHLQKISIYKNVRAHDGYVLWCTSGETSSNGHELRIMYYEAKLLNNVNYDDDTFPFE